MIPGRSPVLKHRLNRAFEGRKGRGTFIKCTDARSSTMTDGYSSRESCGEEVFHIPDDISTFTCTTCDTYGKCYCARPSTVSTGIQDAAVSSMSVPSRSASIVD